MATEEITTHDIKVGDLILNFGMRLRVDQEPQPTLHPVESAAGVTLATSRTGRTWWRNRRRGIIACHRSSSARLDRTMKVLRGGLFKVMAGPPGSANYEGAEAES